MKIAPMFSYSIVGERRGFGPWSLPSCCFLEKEMLLTVQKITDLIQEEM